MARIEDAALTSRHQVDQGNVEFPLKPIRSTVYCSFSCTNTAFVTHELGLVRVRFRCNISAAFTSRICACLQTVPPSSEGAGPPY